MNLLDQSDTAGKWLGWDLNQALSDPKAQTQLKGEAATWQVPRLPRCLAFTSGTCLTLTG